MITVLKDHVTELEQDLADCDQEILNIEIKVNYLEKDVKRLKALLEQHNVEYE